MLVLLLAGAVAGGQAPEPSPNGWRTLTTSREAHSLPLAEARRRYPVYLRAVLTYYDPYIDARHGALFLLDSTGGIFVAVPSRPVLPIRAGMLIDVAGVSGPGDFAPIIDQPQIRAIVESHVPTEAPRVVDDNATSRRILAGALSDWAMRVSLTADGCRTLEALKQAAGAGEPFQVLRHADLLRTKPRCGPVPGRGVGRIPDQAGPPGRIEKRLVASTP